MPPVDTTVGSRPTQVGARLPPLGGVDRGALNIRTLAGNGYRQLPWAGGGIDETPTGEVQRRKKRNLRSLRKVCIQDPSQMRSMEMADIVPAAEFVRGFGRYKLLAQREAVPVSSNGTLAGYFVSPQEYEELRQLKGMRRRFLTADLSDEEVEQIASSRMDSRHDHLDRLLDPT